MVSVPDETDLLLAESLGSFRSPLLDFDLLCFLDFFPFFLGDFSCFEVTNSVDGSDLSLFLNRGMFCILPFGVETAGCVYCVK